MSESLRSLSKYRGFKSTWCCVSARENISLREEHGTNRAFGRLLQFYLYIFFWGRKKKTRDRRKILTKFKHATEEKIVLLLLLPPVYTDVFSFENGCILMHSVFVHRPHFNARKRRWKRQYETFSRVPMFINLF